MKFVDTVLEVTTNVVTAAADFVSIAPADLLIVFILFGLLLGLGFQYGKRRIVALIFSLYFASFLYLYFPYSDFFIQSDLGTLELTALIAGVFFVFFILLFIILIRIINVSFPQSSGRRWLEATLLSTATTTLILALLYHVIPIAPLYDFSSPIDRLFESPEYFFWWLIAPLVVLFFVGKKRIE